MTALSYVDLDDQITRLERISSPHKTLIGPSGWLFLINDRNSALRQQYGLRRWSAEDLVAAVEMLDSRQAVIGGLGAAYLNCSVPEKCAIYHEHLPYPLCAAPIAERPVSQLAQQLSYVVDLSPELFSAKCRGRLFFRGDSHLNWVGSYWCYRAVLNAIGRILPAVREPIELAETIQVTAGYDGDLYEPLPGWLRAQVNALAGEDKGPCTLELTPRLYLRRPRARRVAPPAALTKFCERPTIVTESDDRSLLRAVIIRDSTAQYMIDFLAEHFSRAVFYWHQGAVFEDVIAAERPDIVLHLCSERFILSYPNVEPAYRLTGQP